MPSPTDSASRARTQPLVLVVGDGAQTHRHRIDHTPFVIGRGAGSDLVLPHDFISRRHARITESNGALWIEDTGSRHGTRLNRQPLSRAPLLPGDLIELGGANGVTVSVQPAGTSEHSIRHLLEDVAHSRDSDLSKLNWLLEAARRLNSNGGVDEILSSLIETTLTLTRWERGYVFLCDGSDLRLASARNKEGEPLRDGFGLSRSAIQRALETFEPFILTDTLAAETGIQAQSVLANSIRAIIAMPLRRRREASSAREALGVLYLDSRLTPGVLSETDHGLLHTVAVEAATLVENAQLAQAEAAARRDREELAFAAGIQQRLMQVRLPSLDYASVDARNIPCREVGGDFFDVLHDDTSLSVVVADVSGKGASAAILASTLQGMLYAQLSAGLPLATIARSVNTYLCTKDTGKYATVVIVRATPDGHLEYINCGHLKPILLRSSHSTPSEAGSDPALHTTHLAARELADCNVPIGLLSVAAFSSARLTLQPGDTVVLASDGITEAEDASGEFFGPDRLLASARGSAGSLNHILSEVDLFCEGTPATDDRTLVCIRFRPSATDKPDPGPALPA